MQERQLVAASFLQREEAAYHHSYDEELLQYEYLRDGDPRSVPESKRLFRFGMAGHLSDDPLRDKKYLFVASVTLATRFAIEGGMEAQTAYHLSDLYIQRMDHCRSVPEVYELHTAMIADFTERMKQLRSGGKTVLDGVSRPVSKAVDFIYYHLHERLLLTDIADAAGLSPNYLNALFKKETGLTVQRYIRAQRLTAAKNMLRYSDYTETEIAGFLAFSSTSHFIRVFREETGMTPRAYQKRSFRKHERWSAD